MIITIKLLLILSLSLIHSGAAAPKGVASVYLSTEKTSFAANEPVTIQFTVTNEGKRPVKVLSWLVPKKDDTDDNDVLTDNVFSVSRDGIEISYIGKSFKRKTPEEKDYKVLLAGEAFVLTINDLCDYYDCTGTGEYTITYDVASFQLTSPSGNDKIEEMTSDAIALTIDGRSKPSPPARRAAAVYSSCSATQQSALALALSNAISAALAAKSHAQTIVNSQSGKPRYTTWFGAFQLTSAQNVYNHFDKIHSALSTSTITFDCTCTDSGVYAYVYPSQAYRIYLCGAFWTAPATGTDSKMGTIIHEMSHFTTVATTQDYAYGQYASQRLAISDPSKAVNNADTHEYYAENTPYLSRHLRG